MYIFLLTLLLLSLSLSLVKAKFITNGNGNGNGYCYISSTTPIDKNMIAALGSSDKINTIVNNIIKKHSLRFRSNPQAESIKKCLEAKQKEQTELKQKQEYTKKRLRHNKI
jgi:hypothetical protein